MPQLRAGAAGVAAARGAAPRRLRLPHAPDRLARSLLAHWARAHGRRHGRWTRVHIQGSITVLSDRYLTHNRFAGAYQLNLNMSVVRGVQADASAVRGGGARAGGLLPHAGR